MNCPECDGNSMVIDTRFRKYQSMTSRRRRRCCLDCGIRFTTYEFYGDDFQRVEDKIENFRKKYAVFARVMNETMVFLGLDEELRLEE